MHNNSKALNYSTDQIIDFLIECSGTNKIQPDTDIFANLGLVGDDFHEMIEKYAEKYKVDMANYLWYFHADEEGSWNSLGGIFFKPPYKRVKRILVTPKLLTNFANKAKWDLEYPEHELPKRRYDLIINQIAMGILFIWIIIWAINKITD